MPIDDEDTWKQNYAKIPPDPTGALGPILTATFVATSVTLKLDTDSSAVKFSPQPLYTWIQVPFQTTLQTLGLIPAVDPLTPAIQTATAWAQSTAISQMIIMPGAAMNPPPPGTNGIAAVAVAVVDPSSIAAASQKLIKELAEAQPSGDPLDVVLPVAIRNAFLGLRFIISGIDSKPPPVGPIPFSVTATVV